MYKSPIIRQLCEAKEGSKCYGQRNWKRDIRVKRKNYDYSYWTAVKLSIFFGGFGFDRVYLGYYKDGFIKFITLGGLGVWTFTDIIYITSGYLGPVDGQRYADLHYKN